MNRYRFHSGPDYGITYEAATIADTCELFYFTCIRNETQLMALFRVPAADAKFSQVCPPEIPSVS